MGFKKRRLLHKEQFRAEILTAARELFSAEGYTNFSMRRLAAKIEHSPTTIYLYFRDKDDLLFNICEELYTSFINTLIEIRRSAADPREALRQAFHSYIDFGLAKPEHYKVLFFTNPMIYGPPDEFMKRDTMSLRSYLCFRELVSDCMRDGLLRNGDCDVIAQVFWVAVHGLVTSIIFTADFPLADSSVLKQTLIDGLMQGYAA